MKYEKLFFCYALAANITSLPAQQPVCPSASAILVLSGNDIQARIQANGSLFSDGSFFYKPNPNANNPSTIYAASLWLGGIDPGGNLKLSVGDYGSGQAAGPLNDDGTTSPDICADWDRLFRVYGADVAAFLADLPMLTGNPAAAIAQYKDIMGWPGQGNPYFAAIWGFDLPFSTAGLAPFYDADNDGTYDPLDGDFPAVLLRNKAPFVPATIVWTVFNDSNSSISLSFRMETQLTAWEFNCPDQPVLNRSVFTSHKMIYRGTDLIDSCFAGIWVDFDLGCYTDDFVGCDTARDVFYVYNQDAVDGTTGAVCDMGVATFSDSVPVQSVAMLSHSMDKFIYYNNSSVGIPMVVTTDPDLPLEFYRYLTGHWKDGAPMTFGNSGYDPSGTPTDFAFTGDPADPNDWSMCTSNIPFSDRKALGIHEIGQLAPGAVTEFVTAWTVHTDAELPCGIGSTLSEVEEVRGLYDDSFTEVCSPLTKTSEVLEATIKIFPNPSAHSMTLNYGDLSVREIRLLSADGKIVKSLQNIQPEQTVLNAEGLDSGIYYMQILTENGSATKLVAILR
ncbi:MAG: hypothetical protein EPGJADBJ_03233 [Saprospiraceae bacterium]|nr:hypothetical protein [Saprospiraceae bacterium]